MKKILQLLTTLFMLLALVGCDMLGLTDSDDEKKTTGTDTDPTPSALVSTWWIKGSFDGWEEGIDDRHYFTKDELDENILTYEMTGLWLKNYEFVLAIGDGSGGEDSDTLTHWKASSGSTAITKDAGLTFVNKDTDVDYANATFAATKTSYTIRVDIKDPEAPAVTIIPGTTDTTVPTFAALAESLIFKGAIFDTDWNEKTGVIDADAKTVTYSDLTIVSDNGQFGMDGMDGWFKGLTITSPTVEGESTTPEYLLQSGNNAELKDAPKSDSVYTAVISIDPDATDLEAKYQITFTLQTLGSTDWPTTYDPWTALFIAGSVASWDPGTFGESTITDGVATFTFTADAILSQFKLSPQNDWGGDIAYEGITISETSQVTIYAQYTPDAGDTSWDANGNIMFDSVIGTSYTITVDFTADPYLSTGAKPTVSVTAN